MDSRLLELELELELALEKLMHHVRMNGVSCESVMAF